MLTILGKKIGEKTATIGPMKKTVKKA